MSHLPRILYCHCQYAQVVPPETKAAVLRQLIESGLPFDAVADLCEMSARHDPALCQYAAGAPVKIAACFPRAVKWLFHSSGVNLPLDSSQVLNMRVQSADEIIAALASADLKPNLPDGKTTAMDAPNAPAVPVPTT